jgi:hypothetical protein
MEARYALQPVRVRLIADFRPRFRRYGGAGSRLANRPFEAVPAERGDLV